MLLVCSSVMHVASFILLQGNSNGAGPCENPKLPSSISKTCHFSSPHLLQRHCGNTGVEITQSFSFALNHVSKVYIDTIKVLNDILDMKISKSETSFLAQHDNQNELKRYFMLNENQNRFRVHDREIH